MMTIPVHDWRGRLSPGDLKGKSIDNQTLLQISTKKGRQWRHHLFPHKTKNKENNAEKEKEKKRKDEQARHPPLCSLFVSFDCLCWGKERFYSAWTSRKFTQLSFPASLTLTIIFVAQKDWSRGSQKAQLSDAMQERRKRYARLHVQVH